MYAYNQRIENTNRPSIIQTTFKIFCKISWQIIHHDLMIFMVAQCNAQYWPGEYGWSLMISALCITASEQLNRHHYPLVRYESKFHFVPFVNHWGIMMSRNWFATLSPYKLVLWIAELYIYIYTYMYMYKCLSRDSSNNDDIMGTMKWLPCCTLKFEIIHSFQ